MAKEDRFIPHKGNGAIWSVGLVAFAAMIGVVFFAGYIPETRHDNCLVEDKIDVTMKVETSCGTFQVLNDYGRFIFSTEERFAAIKTGETYDLVTAGWEYRRANTYPNIISYEISPDAE